MPPGEYFLPYIRMIRKIMYRILVLSGYCRPDESDDLMQQVQEILLVREQYILQSFKDRARFSTYLTVVITNICLEIRRKRIQTNARMRSTPLGYGSFDPQLWFSELPDRELLADERMAIQEAARKLHWVLLTFADEMPKIILCLQALYRIPIRTEAIDINQLSDKNAETIRAHLNELNQLGAELSKKSIYFHLTAILEVLEYRTNSPDAIRKWIESRVATIIRLLNGDPPVSSFDPVTLQYLFDYYFRIIPELSPKSPYTYISLLIQSN